MTLKSIEFIQWSMSMGSTNQNIARLLFRGNFGEFIGWYRDDYQKLKDEYLTIRYRNMMYPDYWRYFKYRGEEDKDRIKWWDSIYP